MTLSLPPEVLKFVNDKVSSGQFPDAMSVVVGAIENMRQQEEFNREDIEWLRREVQKGLDELDRGECAEWNAEEVKAEGRRLLNERKKKS